MMTWCLDSAVERNKKAPYTFYIPSPAVIEMLQKGDKVKLIFVSTEQEDEYTCERMWVEIAKLEGEYFIGELLNHPVKLTNLELGQTVSFSKEHISDTEYRDPEEHKWDYYFDSKIIVSNDVLEREEFNFLLRDYPRDDEDTGWTVFSGYEDDEYVNDPDNLQVISIGAILNMDDSVLAFIQDEPQCAYDRHQETGKFVKIHDFAWDDYHNG
ncbi:hypothetical protein J6TS7_58830 [Paenibacillus dendritiformis]|nr:hypothetical protein J6TS7_58830 [Paenibacillus dendritiformis]